MVWKKNLFVTTDHSDKITTVSYVPRGLQRHVQTIILIKQL